MPKIRGAVARARAVAPVLHDDWRQRLRYAWSVRLILIAGLLDFANVVLQVALGLHPSIWFSLLAGAVSMAAVVAKLCVQKNLGGK